MKQKKSDTRISQTQVPMHLDTSALPTPLVRPSSHHHESAIYSQAFDLLDSGQTSLSYTTLLKSCQTIDEHHNFPSTKPTFDKIQSLYEPADDETHVFDLHFRLIHKDLSTNHSFYTSSLGKPLFSPSYLHLSPNILYILSLWTSILTMHSFWTLFI